MQFHVLNTHPIAFLITRWTAAANETVVVNLFLIPSSFVGWNYICTPFFYSNTSMNSPLFICYIIYPNTKYCTFKRENICSWAKSIIVTEAYVTKTAKCSLHPGYIQSTYSICHLSFHKYRSHFRSTWSNSQR